MSRSQASATIAWEVYSTSTPGPPDRVDAGAFTPQVSLLLVGEVYDANNLGHTMFVDWSTISPAKPDLAPSQYLITLTTGSDVGAYVRRVAAAQPDLLDVRKNDPSLTQSPIGNALIIVAAVVIVIGGAAIFNTLLLNARERARDTATLKMVGMSPRQVMAMVAASAALLALVGGAIGLPAGFGVNVLLVKLINSSGGIDDTPAAVYQVFGVWELLAWRYRWRAWPSPWRRRCYPRAGRRAPV